MLFALAAPFSQIGPIRLYGLILALAVLAAWYVASRLAPRFGIDPKHLDHALLWIVIFGFAGARVYFVAFEWDYFRENLGEIWQIWRGGLSIYGAIIGGAAGGLIYARGARLNVWRFFDLGFLVLPLAQALGRWGNFFNQEAFGLPTRLPWKMYIEPAFRPPEYLTYQFFHPTFLYESLWNLGLFLVLLYLITPSPSPLNKGEGSPPIPSAFGGAGQGEKDPEKFSPPPLEGEVRRSPEPSFALVHGRGRPGILLANYLILYPLGRFFIEPLRLDSVFVSGFRVDQIVSLVMMLVGAVLLYQIREQQS